MQGYATILLFIVPLYIWFYTPWRWRKILLIAWITKMAAAIILGLIYQQYYTGGDTFSLFEDGKKLYAIAHSDFTFYSKIVTDVLQGKTITSVDGLANLNPRAVLMSLYNSVLVWLTGGNYWLAALFAATFNFMAIAKLLLQLERYYKVSVLKLSLSFFFFPSVLFWTSGLLKENLLITGLCILLSIYIKMFYADTTRVKLGHKIVYFILLLLVLFILYRLKYYYTAIFAPLLLAHWITLNGKLYVERNLLKRQLKLSKPVVFIATFLLSVLVATLSHPNLQVENVLQAIVTNHLKMAGETLNSYNLIVFDELRPEILSFIKNAPKAFWEGLFRPYLWEEGNMIKRIAALENLFLFLLLLRAVYLYRTLPKNNYFKTEVLFIVLYVLIMSTLLAFAAPNLGTLVRYKVGYLPFLLVLILPNTFFLFNDKRLG